MEASRQRHQISPRLIAWGSLACPFGSALGRWKMGAVFDVIFRIDEEIGVATGMKQRFV